MTTVVSSPTPYCTPAQLFSLVDWRVVADWAYDGFGPRPTRMALLDPTDPAGAVVAGAVVAASGDVESAALRGGRYTVADLQALTGATAAHLQAVVAGVAVAVLAARRNPAAGELDKVPGVKAARQALDQLRSGEAVFGLQAQIDAGKGIGVVEMRPRDYEHRRTVGRARAFFGNRGGDC